MSFLPNCIWLMAWLLKLVMSVIVFVCQLFLYNFFQLSSEDRDDGISQMCDIHTAARDITMTQIYLETTHCSIKWNAVLSKDLRFCDEYRATSARKCSYRIKVVTSLVRSSGAACCEYFSL